ncbi:hypothetical protein ACFOUP_17585 [Belliella kenyensis]|uniref:Uncharacterized protein n=1 Tax=Belliella kenyensis TaxID=1472724 RepID=A0ABV8ES91_9BACT|nr:hypothetical protein [Belliella kenyensis]MCH7402522.1 hypothetical protein [Belliella kenyensis]MDN3603320.1 hypothetical protein [Belliella kenyensis]
MKKVTFKKFRAYYRKHGKINNPGINSHGKSINEQTNWVWFDRETIEAALAHADPRGKVGGLKMYFGQYDEETINCLPKDCKKKEAYIGRISLVLVPANKVEKGLEEVKFSEEDGGWNGGVICPPDCTVEDNE